MLFSVFKMIYFGHIVAPQQELYLRVGISGGCRRDGRKVGRWPELVPDTGSWSWHGRSPGTLETNEILEGRDGGFRETDADKSYTCEFKNGFKRNTEFGVNGIPMRGEWGWTFIEHST